MHRETQQLLEAHEWLVIETRGGADWSAHLVCHGDQWGVVLYQHAFVERAIVAHRRAWLRSVLRPGLTEAAAREAFAAAPVLPRQALVVEGESTGHIGSLARHGAHLVADTGREIVTWDLATRAQVGRWETESVCRDGYPFFKVAIDGDVLATSDGVREFALWTTAGERLGVYRGHSEEVHGLAFVPGDRMISGSGDSSLRLWARGTPQAIATLDCHPIYCVARGPNGLTAGGGSYNSGGAIYLVDDSLELVRTIRTRVAKGAPAPVAPDRAQRIGIVAHQRDDANISALAWHPDGRHLVTGGWDYAVKMFDTQTGKLSRTWMGHAHWVTAIATDGERIVSGCSDGRVRVWAVAEAVCLAEYDLWPGSTEDIYLDGDRIYVASYEGAVYVVP